MKEYPHSPDVAERETEDDGFSAGWGAHHQPSEAYWIDCHTHMRETDAEAILETIDTWGEMLAPWRFQRTVALDGRPEVAEEFGAAADEDERFRWLARLDHDNADLEGLERCLETGACGLKLHNKPVIEAAVDPGIWHSEGWSRIFERMGEAGLPVLWHVTQRLTDAPYTGGGRNSYWEDGWENGAEFTNEDLLDSFLEIVEAHPETDFIGAHQLHLGFDRLAELFAEYPNLHVDTSIGCFVRWGDELSPQDRAHARAFVGNWTDRILFGTDCVIGEQFVDEYLRQHFLGHVRYVRQLRLPDEQLQQISHRNAERLMGLESLAVARRGALRP